MKMYSIHGVNVYEYPTGLHHPLILLNPELPRNLNSLPLIAQNRTRYCYAIIFLIHLFTYYV